MTNDAPERIANLIIDGMKCRSCGMVFDHINHPHTDADCEKRYSFWEMPGKEEIAETVRKEIKAELQAAVAAAYEDAASLCSVLELFPQLRAIGSTIHEDLANDIRARANTDALAARDAQVRDKALREAAEIKLDVEVRTDSWRHAALDTEAAYRRAILALIPADQEEDK